MMLWLMQRLGFCRLVKQTRSGFAFNFQQSVLGSIAFANTTILNDASPALMPLTVFAGVTSKPVC